MNLPARRRFILMAVLGYVTLALAWILLSDRLLTAFVDLDAIVWLSTVKGIFFVLASGAVFSFALLAVPADTEIPPHIPAEFLLTSLTGGAWPRWLSYLFAVTLVLVALVVRFALPVDFATRPLLILYILPIILAALLGGFGPGLAATGVAAVCALYTLPPVAEVSLATPHDIFQWSLLVVSGLTLSLISEGMRRAQQREQMHAQQCNLANARLQESEARYRELFKANPLPMWVYDLEALAFLAVNAAAVAHYGYSRDEFLGMTIRDIRPPEDVPELLAHLDHGRDGLNAAGVWRHRKKDGTLIDVEVSTHTLIYKGHPAKMVLAHDVTERRRAEVSLHQAHERLRRFVDANIVGILIATADGCVIEANDYYLNLIGCTREALEQGRADWLAVTPPEWLPADEQAIAQLRKKGVSAPYEKEYVRRDGTRVSVLLSIAMLPGSEDQIVAFVLDITEKKQDEQERLRLIAELEKRNAELERFTYTVSHDLKSPLVTILGFTGQLEQDLRDQAAESIEADLGFIRGAAGQMGELLDSLLQLSRAGRAIGEPVPVELTALMRDAIEQLGECLAYTEMRIDVPANLPELKGDRVRLRTVFQNLLENAAKFTAGLPEPRIEVGCTVQPGKVLCHVRDNGIGIPSEYQEKIFGLFEQLDPNHGGTGIGLAIVRRIVEEHGGRVWVESAGEGEGSTFFFTLPVE